MRNAVELVKRGTEQAEGHSAGPLAGVGEDTLGGGRGWLARKHGLACNSVIAAEMVTAGEEHLRLDHDNEPGLFWALRGGGGSFGVVTAIEFALYRLPELASARPRARARHLRAGCAG
jgi:hypothetical protein